MRFKFTILLVLLLTNIGLAYSQNRTVSGVVTNKVNGEPILGAAVHVKDTNIGTGTDIDGTFTLTNVPASARTIVVTYIGMVTQEVAISPNMRIEMEEDLQLLDEVIVIAYGDQRKSSHIGSSAAVKADDIASRQVTNVMNTLQGRVAGVVTTTASGRPGATPSIRIRGFSSINAGNDPLIILDGAPYAGGWNNINPSDVESVTVSKDASSNALYGARGANGVIMITTKRAKRGEATVSVDIKVGVNSRATRLYDYITDPGQYYEVHYDALYNSYAGNMTPYQAHLKANQTLGGSPQDGGLGYIVFSVPSGQNLIGQNGRLNPNATLGNNVTFGGETYNLTPDDWFDEAYRTGIRQEYNFNVSGGGDRAQIMASAGYLDEKGIVYSSDYNRFTSRLRATLEAKSWLKFNASANYSKSKDNRVSEDSSTTLFGHLVTIAPIYPVYVRDGEGNIMQDDNGNVYDYGSGNNAGLVRSPLPNTNPLQTDKLETSRYDENVFTGNIEAVGTFLKDFRVTVAASTTSRETEYTSTSQPWYGYISSEGGSVAKYQYKYNTITFRQQIDYSKSIGRHNISATLGHEIYDYAYSYLYASKSNMFSYFGNQELAGAITKGNMNSYKREYNTEGFYLRAMYDYDEKYILQGSYRRDASSKFHPDHRWGNFGSIGAGWLMNKEEWFNLPWVNMLKIKLSWGVQGNDDIGYWRYTDIYNIVDNDGDIALTFSSKGNPYITWETNSSLNAGFDFELFNGRLGGTVDFYHRKTFDMLTSLSVPISLGYSAYYSNIGDMVNNGIEIDLHGIIMNKKNFKWDAYLNMTHTKNRIVRLADQLKATTIKDFGGKEYYGYVNGNYFYGEDMAIYSFRHKKFAGINNEGLPTWYVTAEDGTKSTTTVYQDGTYYLDGDPHPDLYGGFGTTLSFYGFDFSVAFSYQIGGTAYDGGYASALSPPTSNYTGRNLHKDVLKAWTPENPSNTFTRWQYGDTNMTSRSDLYMTDASWLNIQSINLGYTFPSKIMRNLKVSQLRIYVAVDNVYYWSKREGFDPRYSYSGGTSSYTYSPMRAFSTGLSLQF